MVGGHSPECRPAKALWWARTMAVWPCAQILLSKINKAAGRERRDDSARPNRAQATGGVEGVPRPLETKESASQGRGGLQNPEHEVDISLGNGDLFWCTGCHRYGAEP